MRKALTVFGIIVCLGFEVLAHGPNEGCTAIMGGLGIMWTNKPGQYTRAAIEVAPGINYFVRDNISIGGRLGLKTEIMSKVTQSTNNELLGFGRYYFIRKVMGVKASMFVEVNAGYVTAKVKPVNSVNQTRAFTTGALAGFAIFPTENIGFELSLPNLVGFYYSTYKAEFSGSSFEVGYSSLAVPRLTMFVFID